MNYVNKIMKDKYELYTKIRREQYNNEKRCYCPY